MPLTHAPVARMSHPAVRGFALLLALSSVPQLSVGQTVKPADLAGSWAREGRKVAYLTFSDSTLRVGKFMHRWHLAGDTLVIDSAPDGAEVTAGARRLVKIE